MIYVLTLPAVQRTKINQLIHLKKSERQSTIVYLSVYRSSTKSLITLSNTTLSPLVNAGTTDAMKSVTATMNRSFSKLFQSFH